MNRRLVVCSVVALFSIGFISGCTAPTQKVAVAAMEKANAENDKLTNTLIVASWQVSLNAANDSIQHAVSSGDKDAAKVALQKFSNMAVDLKTASVQYERIRSLYRVALQYIYEQKTFFDILVVELKQAKAASDAASTQPVK